MNANDLSVCLAPKLRWFTFRQNNSGGRFKVDDSVDVYVIVQAYTADEANTIAEDIGIYFNGVDDDRDCPCCGDRWYRASDSEGDDVPTIYGEPVPFSVDVVMTVKHKGYSGSTDGVKIYPYNFNRR